MEFTAVECDAVVGVLVPVKTPKEIIALLNREIAAVVALPETQKRLTELGFETKQMSPDELAAYFKADGARWAKIVQGAGIKPN